MAMFSGSTCAIMSSLPSTGVGERGQAVQDLGAAKMAIVAVAD